MRKREEFVGVTEHEYNPFIRPQTEELLRQIVTKFQPKRILEIGTYLGYSASVMLEVAPDAFVTTLEKNEENVKYATENLKELGERVEIVCCDAMDFLTRHAEQGECATFDMIFLDGAKGQYYRYLPFLKKLLRQGGVLVADDVLFYGLVQQDGTVKHKHRSIVENLRKFLKQIQSDTDFDTTLHEVEDGVIVAVLK